MKNLMLPTNCFIGVAVLRFMVGWLKLDSVDLCSWPAKGSINNTARAPQKICWFVGLMLASGIAHYGDSITLADSVQRHRLLQSFLSSLWGE